VRQLFVICTFLIQILGYVSAEAKVAVPNKIGTQKESPITISSSFHQQHPVDVTSSNHFTGTLFNQRCHRAVPAMANWYNEMLPVPVFSDNRFNVYSSPLFLPLTRYLLYPNHYFW
jgi:hypothetical protein